MRQLLKIGFGLFGEKLSKNGFCPSTVPPSRFDAAISARIILAAFLFLPALAFPPIAHCETRLTAVKTDKAPRVDGYGNEPAWETAPGIITRDAIANLDVAIKAVYTASEIFFLVRFADPDESRIQKAWVWSRELKMYEIGPLREDCFIFKWAMDDKTTDLSIRSDEDYTADIWFWKANRTDPAGFADDKYQLLSSTPVPSAQPVISKTGRNMYLKRKGDTGTPAYKKHSFCRLCR